MFARGVAIGPRCGCPSMNSNGLGLTGKSGRKVCWGQDLMPGPRKPLRLAEAWACCGMSSGLSIVSSD